MEEFDYAIGGHKLYNIRGYANPNKRELVINAIKGEFPEKHDLITAIYERIINDKSTRIKIVDGLDSICELCNRSEIKRCYQNKNNTVDQFYIRLYKLIEGEVITAEELLKRFEETPNIQYIYFEEIGRVKAFKNNNLKGLSIEELFKDRLFYINK